jgi:hypothetical protein
MHTELQPVRLNGRDHLENLRGRLEGNIKMDLKKLSLS